MNDIETRVKILEHDFRVMKDSINNSLQAMEKDIDEIKETLSVVQEKVNSIDKKLEAQFAKYNGYSDKFATKVELLELKNEIDNLKAERRGGRNQLAYYNLILTIILTFLMIVAYLKGVV